MAVIEVKFAPGWLLKDVRRASKRLDECLGSPCTTPANIPPGASSGAANHPIAPQQAANVTETDGEYI